MFPIVNIPNINVPRIALKGYRIKVILWSGSKERVRICRRDQWYWKFWATLLWMNVCLPFFTEQWGTLFTKLIILLSCVADLPGEVSSIHPQFNKLFLSWDNLGSFHEILWETSYSNRLSATVQARPVKHASRRASRCGLPKVWYVMMLYCPFLHFIAYKSINSAKLNSRIVLYHYVFIRGLRRRSAAARLLGLWVRIPPGAWMFVHCEFVVCFQVGASATSWSLVQRSPTDCGASLYVV
jgi:hypothetical protein